tara:strand:+ start:193 stop:855 length:663 start_codon:yes stop_codon:yes gene_type:complete
MFAYVKDGSIVSMPRGNQGIKIGDLKYPKSIYTLWTEAERNAIGIYTIEIDETNKKDEEYYINTNITYAYDASSNKVKGTYGSATDKAIADSLYTQDDVDADVYPDDYSITSKRGKRIHTFAKDDVKTPGLKTFKKELIDNQCAGILAPSDWRVIKEQETGSAMDSGWKTWRGNVRTKCNSMQTAIDNASDVAALETLFTYTTDSDGDTTRPLGEFPVKE